MKIKKETIVLVLIITGLSLYLLRRNTDKINYRMPEVPAIAKQDITKIEITGPDETHILAKKGSDWVIGSQEYPADSDKAGKMLDSIAELTLTALVSETKNYHRYDLHTDRKITVRARAGDVLKREFDVGKAADTYRHTFVKILKDDRVFLARDNFRNRFDQKLDELRNKIVLSFNKNTIREIQFNDHQKASKKSIGITLKKATEPTESEKQEADDAAAVSPASFWEKSDGTRAEQKKIEGLLGTLSNLGCEKYIEDGKKEAYENPVYSFSIKGTETYTLSIFKNPDASGGDVENYPAVSSQNDYVFLIAGREVDSMLDKLDAKPEKPETEAPKEGKTTPE